MFSLATRNCTCDTQSISTSAASDSMSQMDNPDTEFMLAQVLWEQPWCPGEPEAQATFLWPQHFHLGCLCHPSPRNCLCLSSRGSSGQTLMDQQGHLCSKVMGRKYGESSWGLRTGRGWMFLFECQSCAAWDPCLWAMCPQEIFTVTRLEVSKSTFNSATLPLCMSVQRPLGALSSPFLSPGKCCSASQHSDSCFLPHIPTYQFYPITIL
jgi:hypothetical protein